MFCFRKSHGAISVFLVIILVPCMLIASLFVDISRVQLARAVAESSADLALSTLMTNYDYDLSEYYGLMGSCQNISEYYSLVTEYYDTALHSQDVDDEEIQLLYQRVMKEISSRFDDETISDILQVQNQTEGAVITPLDGANMYNATILQEQIVEFMKYRGPIVIAQEIVEKINSDKSGVKAFLESDQNKTIVDNKTDFYKAEGELLKAAFDVYWLTRDYTDKVGDNGENMSAGKLQEYAQNLENYRTVYGEIHRYLVGNLMNTGDLSNSYSRVVLDLEKYKDDYDKTSAEIYSRKETPTPAPSVTPEPGATAAPESTTDSSPEPTYYIDGDKVTALLEELTTAKDEFVAAKNDFIDASSGLMNTLPGTGDNDAHVIQWWVQMENAVNSRTGTNYTAELSHKADAMAVAYAKVLAIKDCEPGNDMPPNWESKREKILNDVKSLHGQYLVEGVTDSTDRYLNAVNQLEQVSQEHLRELQPSYLKVDVDGQKMSLEEAVLYIQKHLDEMQKTVNTYRRLLNRLLNEGEDGTPAPMDNLYDLAGNYASALNIWTNSANYVSTDMAKEHRDEIAKLKSLKDEEDEKFQNHQTSDSMEITIDREAVRAMRTRLANIRSQYQIINNAIEEMKYGNSMLLEIMNVDAMKSCAGTVVRKDAIGLTNQEVRGYADSTFSQLFVPNTGTIAALHDISDNAYNPLMSPNTKNIDTPDLYVYMHSKFKDTPRSAVEDEEKEQKEANDQADKRKEEAKNREYRGGGTEITPTESSQGHGFEFAESMLTGLIKIVSNLLNGEVDNIRDDLYVTIYIMEMFSYDTFEMEGKYSIQGKKEGEVKKTELTLSTCENAYARKEGSKEEPGTWLSENPKDTYNKTLTNRLINKDNNAAYLAEVEYILYGESNASNVKAAYEDIYKIRYVVNLISAFANFWQGNNNTSKAINGVAKCIMTLTAGVIPAALTKVILLPILTVFETCNDMDRLAAGFPVELYKQAGDWWYSLEGIGGDLKGIGGDLKEIGGDLKEIGGDEGYWENKKLGDIMDAINNLDPKTKQNPGKGLQYSDYLTLFVYLGLQREDEASEKMYLRMADVIQANMCKATGKSDYNLANTQVYFQLKAKLRVDPLMLTLPYYTDYVDDPTMKNDWCTFEVETIRGY